MISEPVDPDIEKILNRLLREKADNRKEEVANFLGNWTQLSDFDVCLWWEGCYYCHHASGSWQQIQCFI